MKKSEFEASSDGIKPGDLILVLTNYAYNPEWKFSYVGIYSPIEDANHPYVQRNLQEYPNIGQRLINKTYVLIREPAIRDTDMVIDPQLSDVNFSYENTLGVRRLMSKEAFIDFLRYSQR